MDPEIIAGSLVFYVKRYLPGLSKQFSFKESRNHVNTGSTISHHQNEIKGISLNFYKIPTQVTPRCSATPCRLILYGEFGVQLDQATLEDLIPNMGFTVETLYDIDCARRILDHFISLGQTAAESSTPCIADESQLGDEDPPPLTPITMVAMLVEGYLAKVAPDVNLKLQKFQSLAAVIPDYARPLDDGLYRAIDI